MLERQRWIVHEDVSQTVDQLLRGREPVLQVRTVDDKGGIVITREEPRQPTQGLSSQAVNITATAQPTGWRASGRMKPLTPFAPEKHKHEYDFEQMLDQSWQYQEAETEKIQIPGPNGEDLPLYVYPYGVSRSQVEQVIGILNLPIVLTKDLANADVVLALRSHVKNQAKLRQIAKGRQLPIYGVKSNTIPQISRVLKRILGIDEPQTPESADLRLFASSGNDDEIEALEEARLAVEQIVIPTGQPVELLPRCAKIRKMQHELVEHYRLHSDSFGEEPNRRLRIYPA